MSNVPFGFPNEESLFQWVETQLFVENTHDRHSDDRISAIAQNDLGFPVMPEDIAKARRVVCRRKNTNLAKYPFK